MSIRMNRRLFLRKTFMESMPALVIAGAGASSLLDSCSGYTPEQMRVSRDLKSARDTSSANLILPNNSQMQNVSGDGLIINEDTLNVLPTDIDKPMIDNYNRRRYCDIVAQNAEKQFPQSKPFLETMLRANHDYKNIFDIPLEYQVGLIYQESKFDPDAVSYAPAIGIAQFMRATAKDMGIQVYDIKTFRNVYDAEMKLKELNKESNKLWSKVLSSVRSNDFEKVKTYKLEYDKISAERGKYFREAKASYLEVLGELNDQRLNPEISLSMSAKYLAILSRESEKYFGGKHIHNIIRGMGAYNSGFKNVKNNKGLPFIQETIGYIRNIMVNADMISPRQSNQQDIVYDANHQIISELVTNKIYDLS